MTNYAGVILGEFEQYKQPLTGSLDDDLEARWSDWTVRDFADVEIQYHLQSTLTKAAHIAMPNEINPIVKPIAT